MPRTDGIDVAHYQGVVNWPRVRATGAYWAGIKATQGTTFVDPMFAINRRGAAAAGFPFRLLYGWLNPAPITSRPFAGLRVRHARAQAAHYVATVGKLAPGEGAMLDAEQAGITADMVLAWCLEVERLLGRPVAVYTGAYVDSGRIWKSAAIFNGRRPRILAAYTTEANARRIAAPHAWDAWQFIGGQGRVDGVIGPCDLDQIDNPTAFVACCGVPVTPPPPPPFDPARGAYGLYPLNGNKPTVQLGSTGDTVRYLQGVILNKAGGGITVDGVFGPQTDKRVRDLQRFVKITEDGVAGWDRNPDGTPGPDATWPVVDMLARG